MHIVQCTLYNAHCTTYNVHLTMHNVQCTTYIVQSTMCNVQHRLRTHDSRQRFTTTIAVSRPDSRVQFKSRHDSRHHLTRFTIQGNHDTINATARLKSLINTQAYTPRKVKSMKWSVPSYVNHSTRIGTWPSAKRAHWAGPIWAHLARVPGHGPGPGPLGGIVALGN